MTILMTFFLAAAFAPAAAGREPTVSFSFFGPQTTLATSGPFAGDTIKVSGGGSVNTTDRTVAAGGSFTITAANGSVVTVGDWEATAFQSFTSFGGPNAGNQGGQLLMTVALFPEQGAPITGLTMTVNCRIDAPAGFTGREGLTVGDFTVVTRGATLFHLNQ
jgi:hypothetical protein